MDSGAQPAETQVTPEPGFEPRAEIEPWPAGERAAAPFLHGVASGDPLEDRVILWTRVTPASDTAPDAAVDVEWRVAADREQRQVIAQGRARTTASDDYTLHVDVSGLSAGTTYYYQVRALGLHSPRGRT